MIEEVKDLIEDVKDKVGDKGFTVIIVCLVAVGGYLVYRSFNSGTSYYAPTSVTGYPTVGENADVVMDSVNNAIEGSYNDLSSSMSSRFEYIDGVLDNIQSDIGNSTEQIIQNSNQNTGSIIQNSNQNTGSIIQNSNQNTSDIIQNSNQNTQQTVNMNKQEVEELKAFVEALKNEVNNSNNTPQTPVATTQKTTTTQKATSTPKQNTYTYTTKSGLNTNTSIVDALKATGADSSFASRQAIAEANGIKNYTGSYEQNVALLNKMKAGNLVKA